MNLWLSLGAGEVEGLLSPFKVGFNYSFEPWEKTIYIGRLCFTMEYPQAPFVEIPYQPVWRQFIATLGEVTHKG